MDPDYLFASLPRTIRLLPALALAVMSGCIFTNSVSTLDRTDTASDTSEPPQDTPPADIPRSDIRESADVQDTGQDTPVPRDAADSGMDDGGGLPEDTGTSPVPLVVFVNGEGQLSYVDSDRVAHAIADPGEDAYIRAIGPSVDFDGDNVREIPFIGPGSRCEGLCLKLAKLEGGEIDAPDTNVLTRASYGRLAVGDVDGNGNPDIIYPGERGRVKRLDDASAAYGEKVIGRGDDGTEAEAQSILGLVEVPAENGDELRLYWVDDSEELKYTRPRAETNVVHRASYELSAGSDGNIGVGGASDLRDGTAFWPLIDGSNRPSLRQVYRRDADPTELISDGVAAKAPPTILDVAGDERPEFLFVGNSESHTLQHLPTDPVVATSPEALSVDGGEVTAEPRVGLASGTAPTP
jgi:hypothetical protein